MADKWTFKLGTIELFDFEVPQELPLGGDQGTATHDYVGGGRTVQTFGFHRRPIVWTGTLYPITVNGQPKSAQDRSIEFERMVASGKPVDFTYGGGTSSVIVKRYHPTVKHQNQIDYEIELIFIAEQAGSPLKPPSMDSLAILYLTAANLQFTQPFSFQFPPASLLALFKLFLANMNAAFPWSQADPSTLANLIASAQALETGIDTFAQGFLSSPKGVDDLNALIGAEEALSGVKMARYTLQAIQTPPAAPALQSNVNVFDMAARVYGDVSKGLSLLTANGLVDPMITAPIPFVLPSLPPATGLPDPNFQTALIGNNGAG